MATLNSFQPASLKKRFINEVFTRSWWVYAFIILNVIGFSFGFKQLEAKQVELTHSLIELQEAHAFEQKRQEELSFKIKSLEDPKSVELILKQELGLIAEGQTKVHFMNPR